MTKPGKKQTSHRRATATNPELKKRIQRLRRQWKHASTDERSAEVTFLLGKHCSIAGLAKSIHQPASTVRYYSKAVTAGLKEVKAAHLPVRAPAAKGSRKPPTSFVSPQPGTDSSKGQDDDDYDVAKMLLRARNPVHGEFTTEESLEMRPPRSVLVPRADREETVEALKSRPPEIIAAFIRAKLGSPEKPASEGDIRQFLQELRMHVRADQPWKRPVPLPEKITVTRLFEMTKPKGYPEKCDLGLILFT